MSKFKIGNVVRYTGAHHASYSHLIDHRGVVVNLGSKYSSDGAFVNFENGEILFCADINLKLLSPIRSPSPIVTETRRYIKEGDYGILRVKNVSHVKGVVGLYLSPSPFGHYTAEQMRAAAHVLNQIAEVLEENAS